MGRQLGAAFFCVMENYRDMHLDNQPRPDINQPSRTRGDWWRVAFSLARPLSFIAHFDTVNLLW